jgi:nicotinate-nucleotide adenylyltransferase
MTRRVGIFGGTFDPPHIGHLIMASEVAHRARLDQVVLMVAKDPWQKTTRREVTDSALRLTMTRAAVGHSRRLVAGDLELGRNGPTYTFDTVAEWRKRHPEDEVCLVMGADAAAGLDTWHQAERLAAEVDVMVVPRDAAGVPPPAPTGGPWRITEIMTPRIAVSSTDIRRRCRDRIPIEYLVPRPVEDLVSEIGLYRNHS